MDSLESQGTEAWELVLRTHAALVPELDRRVKEATGLPLSWYDVLLELNRAPERRLRMTDLGERVVLSRTRVSRIARAMADAGMLEQRPDPHDGRATLATLTPKGRAALRRAAPTYLAGIDALFSSRITAAEAQGIVTALTRVLAPRS
jgi:DNA-binding MarR family transcriptional regulator